MKRNLPCLVSILVLGSALRLVGIFRGSDGPVGESDFHTFHPDEATLVRAALALADPTEPPLAVQQAHSYTVDGLFTLCALAALWASLRIAESPSTRSYVVAGILVGLATSVRLNGLLLGMVVAAAQVLAERGTGQRGWRRTCTQPMPWWSALAAIVTVLLARDRVTDDFALSAKIASGEILRLWSLVDVHTIPYLHFLTSLLPLAVGWPLAVAMLIGVGVALWQRQRGSLLLVAWPLIYFGFVGWLHTKQVRYLWPMLPFMREKSTSYRRGCTRCQEPATGWECSPSLKAGCRMLRPGGVDPWISTRNRPMYTPTSRACSSGIISIRCRRLSTRIGPDSWTLRCKSRWPNSGLPPGHGSRSRRPQ